MFEKQHIIKHVLFAHRNTVFNDILFHKEKKHVSIYWTEQFKICKTIWKKSLKLTQIPTCASSLGWSVNKLRPTVPLSEMALWNKPLARGDTTCEKARTSMTITVFYPGISDFSISTGHLEHFEHFESPCGRSVPV